MVKVYEIVTERLVAMLEEGTVPWRKTWKTGLPKNLISRREYRGINAMVLGSAGFSSAYWLTYRQAKSLGGFVKEGEHGWPCVFWKRLEQEENEDVRSRASVLRYYTVFNVAQCECVRMPVNETPKAFSAVDSCESIIRGMPAPPEIEHGGDEAAYMPREDRVRMPLRERFENGEHYYSTLFHELVHSTGHGKRIGRREIMESQNFGSDPYSQEELTAEVGASFLCGKAEIESAVLESSASYISGWLGRLRKNHSFLVQAATHAQKAADYILNENGSGDPGE